MPHPFPSTTASPGTNAAFIMEGFRGVLLARSRLGGPHVEAPWLHLVLDLYAVRLE